MVKKTKKRRKHPRRLFVEPLESRRLLAIGLTGNETVYDDASGNEWLQLSKTINRAYNDVSSELGLGGEFEGWAFGSRTQIFDVFRSGGFSTIPPPPYAQVNSTLPSDYAAATDILSKFERTFPVASLGLSADPDTRFTNEQYVVQFYAQSDGVTSSLIGNGNIPKDAASPIFASFLHRPAQLPDIVATDVTVNGGTVDVKWNINNYPVPKKTTVQLYWSDDTTFDGPGNHAEALADPIEIAAGTPTGSYQAPGRQLTPQPSDATHLLLVVDPDNEIIESDEPKIGDFGSNNVLPEPVVQRDIEMLSASLTGNSSVGFQYSTTGTINQSFTVGLYPSTDTTFDPADPLLSFTTVTPSPTNPQSPGVINFDPALLAQYPNRPHLLVVADPISVLKPNGDIDETDDVNNNVAVVPLPDIAATGLTWATGGVEFSYRIDNSDLTQSTTAAFYWVNGSTVLAGPFYNGTLDTIQGAYGPLFVPIGDSVIPDAPAGTTNLLLVLDPDNRIRESDELSTGNVGANNKLSLGPDIVAKQLSWDPINGGLEYSYEIVGISLQDLPVGFFWSQNYTPVDPAPAFLDQRTTDLEVGTHGPFNVQMEDFAIPEPPNGATHLVFRADPWDNTTLPNGNIEEPNEGNNAWSVKDVALTFLANEAPVAEHSKSVIKSFLRTAGQSNASVSSTFRSFDEQAELMFCQKRGTCPQNGRIAKYGPTGREVLKLYDKLTKDQKKNPSITDADIVKVMRDLIEKRWNEGKKVSLHTGTLADYKKENAIDLKPSSFSSDESRNRFFAEMSDSSLVSECGAPSKFLKGSKSCFKDSAFHLAIPIP